MKRTLRHPQPLALLGLLASSGALLLSGCGGGANAAPIPKTETANGNLNRIAFSSNRDGNFEIYTVKPDGTDVQRVTTATGDDTKPAWSRDKTKLAFVSERDGNAEIYVQNIAEGKPVGAPQRITNDPAFDGAPSWNPDGTQLVFQSERDKGGQPSLYIVNTGTLAVRRLTQRPGQRDFSPAWSPQGDLIVFNSRQVDDGTFRSGVPSFLFTVKVNGEDVRQITNGLFDFDAAWNPDGSKIAFTRAPFSILTLDLKSEVETRLELKEDYRDPTYSPDGRRLAFIKPSTVGEFENVRDSTNIFLIDLNSPDQLTQVTNNDFLNQDVTW